MALKLVICVKGTARVEPKTNGRAGTVILMIVAINLGHHVPINTSQQRGEIFRSN
jgi:hypothetical protein